MSSFDHYMRRAINPALCLDRRRYALGECLRKLGTLTWQEGEFRAHRQAVRAGYNSRFGFDDQASDTDRINAAVSAAHAEYSQLQEGRRLEWRRQAAWKARGRRIASDKQRQATVRALEATRKQAEERL